MTISLIWEKMADKLLKGGAKLRTERWIKIKVANGNRASLDYILQKGLRLGGNDTDPIQFFVLKELPFDVFIGNLTLRMGGGVVLEREKIIYETIQALGRE